MTVLRSTPSASDTGSEDGGDNVPHYVVSLDIHANTVVVLPLKKDAMRKEVMVREVQWVYRAPKLPCIVQAQARYREKR